jgi:hypothetical protein
VRHGAADFHFLERYRYCFGFKRSNPDRQVPFHVRLAQNDHPLGGHQADTQAVNDYFNHLGHIFNSNTSQAKVALF